MSNRNKPISREATETQQAVAALARRNDWRKWSASRQLEYLCACTSALTELAQQLGPDYALARLYHACTYNQPIAERKRRERVLLDLAAKRAAVLQRPEMCVAVAALVEHHPWRRRELADWMPKSKNAYRQLESLIRHLFDGYGDLPGWVINAWLSERMWDGGVNIADLTIHLGRGNALRSFRGLPVSLTKRLEHEMRQAPAGCTFIEALRYAQLAARDALEWLGLVLETRFGREIGPDDAFWLGVVDFFAAAPMVDPRQFGPVCDWIRQKRSVGIGLEPPQPGFSLKGRTMASVIAQMEQWHRSLGRVRRHGGHERAATWPTLPVSDFVSGADQQVTITQLRTYGELVEEGQMLHHCVASYLASCQRGKCGIFSLKVNGARALTLEVLWNRTIVQIRGRYNRRMALDECFWVSRWATEAQLQVSKHA
ncbi:PcfJ domain-containing protein [Hymenobacter crusticola]|uniref:PcfJ-like protein n=1 Tax=Hymenobacter crusticola TaxID=1770526 RepID=A0A243WF43_9BACT|nr:PcfJ domain-containing protein [Hymenobacter crusticola]OUJ74272.1 hypothetical protein BXP70_11165 [Hymenobacter crusticola]